MEITVYTGAWCGPSVMLRLAFKRNKIAYTNMDINGCSTEADKAGVAGTPTIVISYEDSTEVRLIGYNDVVLERIKGLIKKEEDKL